MNDGEKASNGPSLDQGGSEDFCANSSEDGLEHPAAPAPGGQLGLGLEEDDCTQPKVGVNWKRKLY